MLPLLLPETLSWDLLRCTPVPLFLQPTPVLAFRYLALRYLTFPGILSGVRSLPSKIPIHQLCHKGWESDMHFIPPLSLAQTIPRRSYLKSRGLNLANCCIHIL